MEAPLQPVFEPPHPALKPVRNEPLRLLMAEQEAQYIRARLKRSKRWMIAAAVVGTVAPAMPVALFWNNGALFDWALDQGTTPGAAAVFAMIVGVAAPVWALVRIGFEYAAFKRYVAYKAEHDAFLARYDRCPADARAASMPTRRTG